MKYNVGDVVTITTKHIDECHMTPNHLWINSEMMGMAGQKYVIRDVYSYIDNDIYALCGLPWTWDKWCFEETAQIQDLSGVEELI